MHIQSRQKWHYYVNLETHYKILFSLLFILNSGISVGQKSEFEEDRTFG